MASHFGEVIHPSSRAFWQDDENDLEFENECKINWTVKYYHGNSATVFAELENLLIIEGDLAADFAKSCFLRNAKEVGSICGDSDKYPSKIYENNRNQICVINSKLNLADTGSITEAIIPLTQKAKKILLLTNGQTCQLKGEEDCDNVLIKTLCSSKAQNIYDHLPTLQQPNIVTGVCAGVLSYAEMNNLDCTLYKLFVDTFSLDSKTAAPLVKLFSNILQEKFVYDHFTGSAFLNKGNLYM